ncbi:hypothetical protein [Nostoc sp. DedQUE09]|uniref:hypothetical protein n=1 Tax=Nostoc sp. DedQUE09 TaxID=3075394 RepID=UPI002AD4980B|nr:hypothetical protein [Nostoc sp. DedQUE09]MDZ7951432.1 hypothetical protein [Nostoc sp. DedQUE09]
MKCLLATISIPEVKIKVIPILQAVESLALHRDRQRTDFKGLPVKKHSIVWAQDLAPIQIYK